MLTQMIVLCTVVHGLLQSLDLRLVKQRQQILARWPRRVGCTSSTYSSYTNTTTDIAFGQHLLQREHITCTRRHGMGEQLTQTRTMTMGRSHRDGAEATLLRGSCKAQRILLLCREERIGAMGQQQSDHLKIPCARRQLQRRQRALLLAAARTALHFAATFQQDTQCNIVRPTGGEAQRCPVLCVRLYGRITHAARRWHLHIWITTGVEKGMQCHLIVAYAGHHERSQSGAVLRVVARRGR